MGGVCARARAAGVVGLGAALRPADPADAAGREGAGGARAAMPPAVGDRTSTWPTLSLKSGPMWFHFAKSR